MTDYECEAVSDALRHIERGQIDSGAIMLRAILKQAGWEHIPLDFPSHRPGEYQPPPREQDR